MEANNTMCPKCIKDTFLVKVIEENNEKVTVGKCSNCGFEDSSPTEEVEKESIPKPPSWIYKEKFGVYRERSEPEHSPDLKSLVYRLYSLDDRDIESPHMIDVSIGDRGWISFCDEYGENHIFLYPGQIAILKKLLGIEENLPEGCNVQRAIEVLEDRIKFHSDTIERLGKKDIPHNEYARKRSELLKTINDLDSALVELKPPKTKKGGE
jgi:Zn ribbon nucleic-acid-binding protein